MKKRTLLECDMVKICMSVKATQFYKNNLDKFFFIYANFHCISDLCCKFQIPASNTVCGFAATRTLLQCDMVKIYMSFKGT